MYKIENDGDLAKETHRLLLREDNENVGVDIEEGFQRSGDCGRYQIMLQLIFSYLVVCIASASFVPYFILDDPAWTCNSNSTSPFCQEHFGKSFSPDSDLFYERCRLERSEWSYTRASKYSVVTEYDLVCNLTAYAETSNAVHYVGGVIGSIICGKVADTYGRKIVMVICLFIHIVSSVGCAYVTQIWQLIALRGMNGASSLPCFNIAAVYLMEFVPTSHRALSGLMYQGTYCLSLFLLDGIGWLERNWRRFLHYITLPSVFALISFLSIPESPRWLFATGKINQAELVLNKIATKNNTTFIGTLQSKNDSANKGQSYSYWDLFRYKKIAILTSAQAFLWLTTAMLYFAITLESSKLGGDMYAVFAWSVIAEIPGSFTALYVCNRFGRKKCILGSLFMCAIFTGSIALIPKSHSMEGNNFNICLALLAKFFVNLTFNAIYIWTFEINPTVIRSQGLNFCATLGYSGGIFSPYLVGSLQSVNHSLPFVTMFIVAILACLSGMVLPETRNLPTREVYEDFFDERRKSDELLAHDILDDISKVH